MVLAFTQLIWGTQKLLHKLCVTINKATSLSNKLSKIFLSNSSPCLISSSSQISLIYPSFFNFNKIFYFIFYLYIVMRIANKDFYLLQFLNQINFARFFKFSISCFIFSYSLSFPTYSNKKCKTSCLPGESLYIETIALLSHITTA